MGSSAATTETFAEVFTMLSGRTRSPVIAGQRLITSRITGALLWLRFAPPPGQQVEASPEVAQKIPEGFPNPSRWLSPLLRSAVAGDYHR